ncbi:MAG: acyl-CoA thioesterase [Pseudomonadales bacterium]
MKDPLSRRTEYNWFTDISTRWMDNDIYGHINNVVYYSYFDSIANKFLIEEGGLDIHNASTVGFVVASSCQYLSPLAYPMALEGGFRVNKLGNSSVEYGLAIFEQGRTEASAHGTFTHVFVEQASNKSTAIPARIRSALEALNPER